MRLVIPAFQIRLKINESDILRKVFHAVTTPKDIADEFAHRYNTRKQPIDARFAESAKQFGAARLKYRELTPDQREPHRKARYNKAK